MSSSVHRHPRIDPPRTPEVLLIVLDVSAHPTLFPRLRDTAFRLARKRLIYPVNNDLLGLFLCGAARTQNPLAERNPDGYGRIDAVVAPVANQLRAVRALHAARPSPAAASHLFDVLDVAGDALCNLPATIGRVRRLILFTSGTAMLDPLTADDLTELCDTLTIFRKERIQLNFVLDAPDGLLDEIHRFDDLEEEDDDKQDDLDREHLAEQDAANNDDAAEIAHPNQTSPFLKMLANRARPFKLAHLLLTARATGGVVLPLSDAATQAEGAAPRPKRAMAKFRGVLDIAGVLHIPVKRFSYVAEANAISATRLSWEATRRHGAPISALVETQRVASARADAPLAPDGIVNAFPYGPDLVPEPAEVDTYAWHMMCESGLQVLGFVRRKSVPHRLFLGKVDVVVAMNGVPQAKRALRSLVIALHAERLGVLARSVMAKRGGPPSLCFLWPRVEVGGRSGAVRNCFLFAVDIPMREDVRDMPFDSLHTAATQAKTGAQEAMERLISSSMLEPVGSSKQGDEDEESDEEDGVMSSKPFSPAEWPNPSIDWFNTCIVHRALQGIEGSDLPPRSKWHEEMMSPEAFLKKESKKLFNESVDELKSLLPILPVETQKRRGRRVYEAAKGDLASIGHFLPESDEEEGGDDENEQHEEYGEVFDGVQPVKLSEGQSELTHLADVEADVGDVTPVEDFERLVRRDRLSIGALSLHVIIRRLIREVVDDEKAASCLRALRRACVKKGEHHLFNEFVRDLARRCERQDAIGNRTAAFFRFVGRRDIVVQVLGVIPPCSSEARDRELLDDIARDIDRLCAKPEREVSASNVTA